MKTTGIIGWLWAVLLLWAACHSEVSVSDLSMQSGGTALRMSVGLEQPQTVSRAFPWEISANNFPPLWVVAFDGSGYLVEYTRAENMERQGDELFFDVVLRETSQKRILHFLLGYPSPLRLAFGHESAVIGRLQVSGSNGVCWQRKVLPHGISQEKVVEELRRIPLLRNFARIRVVNRDPDDFRMTGFYVLNIPMEGRVAPYHGGRFVDYWTGTGKKAKDYATLVDGEHYTGAMPDGVTYGHRPGGKDENLEWVPGGGYHYLYELTHTGDAATTLSVMLKGSYRGGRESYYKVDLVREEQGRPVYYHILRNFEYVVHIDEVIGEGESSFEAASLGLSGNNLSSSVVVRKVLNVSDGIASLRVAYTDTTLVSDAPVRLRFKFVPDIRYPRQTRNEAVSAILLEGDYGNLFDPVIERNETPDGWATFILKPLGLPPYPKRQSVLIRSDENALSREVVFEIRPPMTLEVSCAPRTIQGIRGESVVVTLFLPHQLGESLFPLDFLIEAQEEGNVSFPSNLLSPQDNETVSVHSGKSIVSGLEGRQAIQYISRLTYGQYLQLPRESDGGRHLFRCHFVTTTRRSASRVFVYNKYFARAVDHFSQF